MKLKIFFSHKLQSIFILSRDKSTFFKKTVVDWLLQGNVDTDGNWKPFLDRDKSKHENARTMI